MRRCDSEHRDVSLRYNKALKNGEYENAIIELRKMAEIAECEERHGDKKKVEYIISCIEKHIAEMKRNSANNNIK